MTLLHSITPTFLAPTSYLKSGIYALPNIVVTFDGTISATSYLLGTTTQGRSLAGSNANGKEFVDEKWLELNKGAGWVPVGGGPDGDMLPLVGTTTVQARLNIPAGVTTTGDFLANLELFYVE